MSATAWAASLTRVRDVVNPAVAALTADGIAPTVVAEALREVGPSFDAHCAPLEQSRRDAWAQALALAVVAAHGRRSWSPRTVVPWTVTELLPRLAPGVASPERVVPDVVHAAGQVWVCADVGRWGRLLLACAQAGGAAPPLSATALRDIGAVAAWRSGHVRLRAAAHRVGPGLSPALLAAALDVADPATAHVTLAGNAEHPATWLPDETDETAESGETAESRETGATLMPAGAAGTTPAGGPARSGRPAPSGRPAQPAQSGADTALATVGGFIGFGGPFHRPPVVVAGDGVRWRLREQAEWDLTADVHGRWLERVDPDAVSWVSAVAAQQDPTQPPGRTAYGRSVLVTSPHSHLVVHARGAA